MLIMLFTDYKYAIPLSSLHYGGRSRGILQSCVNYCAKRCLFSRTGSRYYIA